MRFVPRSEAVAFFQRLGLGPSGLIQSMGRRFKSEEFRYRSRLTTAPQVSSLLVEAMGRYDEAMVWPHYVVFGDRSHDADAPPDWVAYRKWRVSHGASLGLHDAPGHLLVADERDEFIRLLELAIYLGWDALVGARRSKVLIELSHHDTITFHSRSRPSQVMAALERHGLVRQA